MGVTKRAKKSSKRRGKTARLSKGHLSALKSDCTTTLVAFERDFEETEAYKKLKSTNKSLVRLLKQKTVSKSLLPQNRFYDFINVVWMRGPDIRSESQKYIVQVDSFRLAQHKIYGQVVDIIKNYIKTNKTTKAQQLDNIFKSSMRLLDDSQARAHVNRYITYLDNTTNPWTFLGTMNKNEIISFGLPLVFSLNPDEKHSKVFRCGINGPQLSLVDFTVYDDNDLDVSYRARYRREYMAYIERLFVAFLGKNHGLKARDVFDVEVQLLVAMGCNGIKEDPDSYYNKVTGAEAASKYGFDWATFSKALGFGVAPEFFITGSLNYLKCGSELFVKEWKSEKWRAYWVYIYARQVARFHRSWRNIEFDFCGKFMRGQDAPLPREFMPVFCAAFAYNTLLTDEYLRVYANPQAIQYVKNVLTDLVIIFRRKLERNTWMQPSTRKSAIKKLDHFKIDVGSPPELRADPDIEYNSTDIWENFSKIVAWRTKQACLSEGGPVVDVPIIDWGNEPIKLVGTQAFVANASYTPSQNGIYIPMGYIQPPFLDMAERGIEYNLSQVIFTCAHEISHSCDDMGSQYDYQGNLNNWWTPEDKRIFKRKQNDVIRQFEEVAASAGITYDASMAVGECIADINGLSLCVEYLRDFQEKNGDVTPIRNLSYKAFFIYFAVQSRQHISRRALAGQLKSNPHPPSWMRCDIPLSRIELFRDMYNIKQGDGMWWHNTDTIF
jgi:putative endopeptidase